MAIRARRRTVHSDSYVSLPWGLIGTVILVGGLGYGIYWVIKSTDARAEREKNLSAGTTRPKPAPPKPAPLRPPTQPRSGPGEQPVLKPSVQKALVETNTAFLSAEACRIGNDSEGRFRHIREGGAARNRLSEAARGESDVPDNLESSDEVLGVDDVDFTRVKPEVAADRLWNTLQRIYPGTTVKAKVKRNGEERDLYLYFPVSPGGVAAPAAGGRRKISNDLAMEIQQKVLSLPAQSLGTEDRREIERILGQGDASEEEYAFLLRRLARDDVGAMQKEKESFQKQLDVLGKMLPGAFVPDALLTKDGRKIPGQITGETQVAVTVTTAVCPVAVDKTQIRQTYTAKELREEFDRRSKPSENHREALQALLAWTREWGLPVHREYVAHLLLQIDPNDRAARLAAGYYQAAGGKWILGPSIAATGSYAAKKPETRAEMQPELEAFGFKLQGGKWYTRVAWSAGIENLHRAPDFKVSLQGCTLFNWYEVDTPNFRLDNPSGKPKDPSVMPRLRFYAPSAQTGTINITVEAPGALEDCQVKAVGYIIEKGHGARIEVMVTPEGDRTYPLYAVDEAGSEAFHDVSSMVRGKKKFLVTARLTTKQDKYHTYARFLPSIPESKESFWVKGSILQAAPDVDRVWLAAKP